MPIKFTVVALIAFAMTWVQQAQASSDAAWQELAAKMTKACLKASDLDGAKVKWSSLDFELKTAAIVTGKWKQKSVKGQKAALLCLYDKKTGKVEIQEFDVRLLK